jgi:hypothetical protein
MSEKARLSDASSPPGLQPPVTVNAQLQGTLESLQEHEKKAKEILDQAVTQIAAQSRRQAVLKGLADLGYQVSERMETAWVQNGSVVVKRKLESGYGVEMSGKIDSGRVQMRTVAFRKPNNSADVADDTAAETVFCNDVSKLQEEFAEAGNQILIERHAEIGTTPLKIVSLVDDRQEELRERMPPVIRQRSIE